jgi:hypothetical protein
MFPCSERHGKMVITVAEHSMKMTEGCFISHFLIARHMQKLQEI